MAKNRAMAAKNARAKQLSMKASKDARYRRMQASYIFDDFANSVIWNRTHMPNYIERKNDGIRYGRMELIC